MDTPRIYVACLAAYNSGILYGEWIRADQTSDDIRDEIQTMLAASPIKGSEEWAIHSFEGFFDKTLSEYEDLDTVANLAEFIIKHGDLGGALLGLSSFFLGYSSIPAKNNYFHNPILPKCSLFSVADMT